MLEVTKKCVFTILIICSFGFFFYGLLVFSIMPATGVYVAVIALVCIHFGMKKSGFRIHTHLNRLKEKIENWKEEENRTSLLILYPFNIVLISILLPDFDKYFGDDLGFIVSGIIGLTVALYYTGFIIIVFQTFSARLIVTMMSWAPIIVKMVNHNS